MLNQKEIFAARLQRIAAHSGNTNATLHVGMDDQLPQAALLRHAMVGKTAAGGSRWLMGPLALIAGALSWFWAQWALPVILGEAALWQVLLAAVAATLLLRLVLGLKGMVQLGLQAAGLGVAHMLFPAGLDLSADAFAALTTHDWMATVMAHGQPIMQSLGATFL